MFTQTHRKWPGVITRNYLEFVKVLVNVTYSAHFTLEVDKLHIFCGACIFLFPRLA